jgi:hypothetical protein
MVIDVDVTTRQNAVAAACVLYLYHYEHGCLLASRIIDMPKQDDSSHISVPGFAMFQWRRSLRGNALVRCGRPSNVENFASQKDGNRSNVSPSNGQGAYN